MKKLNSGIFLIFLSFFLTSCAGYVANVHRELDREMAEQRGGEPGDNFEHFRKPKKLIPPAQRVRPNRRDSNQQSYAPRVKRQYRQTAQRQDSRSQERVTASDLVDNNPSQSLWVDDNENRDLFTDNKSLKQGDIVLVNVYKKLKNEITLELKRAFPTAPTKKKDGEEGAGEGDAAEREPADDEMAENETKVYDRISTVIVEEVNKDHVLLRGRKNLIYKNRKRLVEVQALVARRDLTEADTVDSNNIIESSISVLR